MLSVQANAGGPAAVQNPAPTNPPVNRTGRSLTVTEKMNLIIIPEIEFRQANIRDVTDFLVKASIEGDTFSPPDQKGVNIVLNLNPPGVKPAPVHEITFSARNISMLAVLKTITQVSGLTYRTEGNIVMIIPAK
jgi:hypothetical protein